MTPKRIGTPDEIMARALEGEQLAKARLRKRLKACLGGLMEQYGADATLSEPFWLEVMAVIAADPFSTCGNMVGAVSALRGCQEAIERIQKRSAAGDPLREFREMAKRVTRLRVVGGTDMEDETDDTSEAVEG